MKQQLQVQGLLEHHWAMDGMAAAELTQRLPRDGLRHIIDMCAELDPVAVALRDQSRERLGALATLASDESLAAAGPCSADKNTASPRLSSFTRAAQMRHPDVMVAERLNGKKPRSSTGFTGTAGSVDPMVRQEYLDILKRDFKLGIPILTEATSPMDLGAYAPYLCGYWLGTRDMESTELRLAASMIHMTAWLKNGRDGDPARVEDAVNMIRSNTVINEGSGANLGTIASGPSTLGYPTGYLPVGHGNPYVGIIPRGYELPAELGPTQRYEAAIAHLNQMLDLAHRLGCAAVLDGVHKYPAMFEIDPKAPSRFQEVMGTIAAARERGEFNNPHALKGFLWELGTSVGRTDPNAVIGRSTARDFDRMVDLVLRFKTSGVGAAA